MKTNLRMRKCPDCPKTVKRQGEPTLSPGDFLDQIIVCDCGWCGVEFKMLSRKEAKEFRAKPRQLQLF